MKGYTVIMAGVLAFLTGSGTTAFADILNLSTGLDSGGNLITTDLGCDAHWSQTAGPAPACAGSKAQAVQSNDLDWSRSWLADGPDSDWITSNATVWTNGNPLPTYQIQFYLSDTVGASFSGSWTIDDAGSISLNGHQIGSLGIVSWGSLTPIGGTPSADLVAGLNTLSISLSISDNFLEGVRFQGLVSGDGASFTAPVPEPSSLVLFAAVVAGLGIAALRRRRASVEQGC